MKKLYNEANYIPMQNIKINKVLAVINNKKLNVTKIESITAVGESIHITLKTDDKVKRRYIQY